MPGELLDNAKIAFVRVVNGRFDEAAELFGQVLEKTPGHLMAYHSGGAARLRLDGFEGAVADFALLPTGLQAVNFRAN